MTYETEFVEIPLDDLQREASIMKANGWRFIQTHAVNGEDGVDLYYSFMKDGAVRNYKIAGVKKETPVQSITNLFLAAFVFENEARELFGVDMRDIAIDFQGAMYAPAEPEPMTFMSPEQKAARDKAAKAAAAKAAKGAEGDDAGGDSRTSAPRGFVMTQERRARLDAKLATMSPEKVAKVQAALKAREAEAAQADSAQGEAQGATVKAPASTAPSDAGSTAPEASSADATLEKAIAALSPDKAAKVRAALARKSNAGASPDAEQAAPVCEPTMDAQLEAKIAGMDPAKAEKVRAALRDKAARGAAHGGGE